MKIFQARVVKGRLVLDEPTQLPEGTVLHLVVVGDSDDLDDKDRASLHAAINESQASLRAGHGIPAHEVLRSLRKRR